MEPINDPIDRCTSWWDGIPEWMGGTGTEWRHCCRIHDDFYANQTWLDVLAYVWAHVKLGACVGASGFYGMGVIMAVGLMTLGGAYVVHRHNKHKPGGTKSRD